MPQTHDPEPRYSDTLLGRLAGASSVAVLTGAGISAESGIPTFRDPGGIWEQFRPEELANVNAFMKNPKLVQGWYLYRREMMGKTMPNPAHRALVELEALVPSFTLITQNIDNLHQRAGSQNIIELHGNITRCYCFGCHRPATDADLVPPDDEDALLTCPDCSGLFRPDVVWFGEMLPEGAMEAATQAAIEAEVFLSIGTSAVVYPAAGLPLLAVEAGAYVAEVNIAESDIAPYLHEVVLGKAGTVLPQLIHQMKERIA